jgi:hypothetical protein
MGAVANQRFTLDDFDMEDRASSITSSGSGRAGAPDSSATEVGSVIRALQSGQWQEKRVAVDTLRALFNTGRPLSTADIRRLTDAFTRALSEQQPRTYALYIDAVIGFVANYNAQLTDWVYTLLNKLMHKLATETSTT